MKVNRTFYSIDKSCVLRAYINFIFWGFVLGEVLTNGLSYRKIESAVAPLATSPVVMAFFFSSMSLQMRSR